MTARRNNKQVEQVAASAARVALRSQAGVIANRAAKAAVREFVKSPEYMASMEAVVAKSLGNYGIDVEHPEEARKDMDHVRTWRDLWEFSQRRGISAAINWVVGAGLLALVSGIALLVHRNWP